MSAAAAAAPTSGVMEAGSWVLVRVDDERGTQLFVQLGDGATIPAGPRLGVQKLSLKPMIGTPFGTHWMFDPTAKGLVRCSTLDTLPSVGEDDAPANKDNRELLDDNQAQTTSADDLRQLRKEGATGDDLVKKCVEGSTTFASKTAFSQQKYIRKKQKRWDFRCSALEPTLARVIEYYVAKKPEKAMSLRVDSLAQLLNQANVHANSRTIVVDNAAGLVCGAVVQRQGGMGRVYNLCRGAPNNSVYDWLSLSSVAESTLRHVALTSDPLTVPPPPADAEERAPRDHRTVLATTSAVAELVADGASSLVVCAQHDPTEVFTALLPLLAAGCSFSFFCKHPEPLLSLSQTLRKEKTALNVLLTESFWREYQVLPDRTHPHVWMNMSSGFILSGQVVENTNERWRAGVGRTCTWGTESGGGAAAAEEPGAKRQRTE
eukprot:TRINITY_DN40661_c0_g1_i1.p1 TRINITY_DN40661_c0_g1~~TRINITY_DN40661_c0_g1_i1.p1  ORF type:complete len:433 (+),score=139.25 TRINITY_DN40661_c0_g1_i1:50-1348(+)